MTVITMSCNELARLRVLIDVADGRLSVADATGLIGVGRRQIYRLLHAFRTDGPDGLISRKRDRPSNRALGAVFRETVLSIVRDRYVDFGPTLAAEKLSELHGLDLGVETLRQWMIGAGLWVRRKDRLKRIHQPRARRDCLGELVQIDGSEHWWFEDRGPQSTLLVYIDDATSRLMHLKFVGTESTFDYFQATREYLEAHGKPVAFYSDKHGVFRVNNAGAVQGRACPCEGGGHDPVRTVAARPQHRHSVRQHAASAGPRRARQQDLTGSPGQGIASSGDQHDRRR
jgi:hypothetical protein